MLKHERISDIMKSLKTIIWVIGAMFLLVTCKKDPGYGIEDLKIVSDVVVGTNSATITGTYYYPGEIKVIKACITKGESAVGEYAVELNGKEFTVEITGLQPSTTYQYYYKVDHGASEPYVVPESREFTTQSVTIMDDMPTVQILEMLPIDSATCRVKCEVLDDGGSPVVERGICWNTHGNPTMADATVRCDSAGLGMYTVYMEQLSLGHQYYVRAYAQNATGVIGQSNVVDFEMSALPGMSIDVHVSCEPEEGGTTTGGGSYEVGTQCTVTATPNPGYTFVNWTENGNQVWGEERYSFPVNVERNLVANFSAEAYIISVVIEPEGGGTATGAGGYAYGDTCRLIAMPRTGYDFVSWTRDGAMVSQEAECSFIVIESETFTAHFQVKSYAVTVTSNPIDGGSVSGDGIYEYGMTCTVHAVPSEGYAFDNWTDDGDIVSTSADYSFMVMGNRNLKANFSELPPDEYTVTVLASPTEGGTVNSGGTYEQGQQCTVSATANEGYTFTKWTENGEVVSTNANWTFTVTSNRILMANFNYNGGSGVPPGAINGLFTINAKGDQVYFSQGNLQYQASTNTWRFAENQWDFVGTQNPSSGQPSGGTISGSDNYYISQTYSGWIDLFGWGTSGYNHGAVCYQPWSISESVNEYRAYGSVYNNLYDQTGQADWGCNSISNGGNVTNTWRTLAEDEWGYVLNNRITSSGIRYAKAQLNNINGLILLPDDWDDSYYSLNHTNSSGASYTINIISSSQWSTLEQHGAIFLPASGFRVGTSIYGMGSSGYYYSSEHAFWGDYSVSSASFSNGLNSHFADAPYKGHAVRLVRNVQ